MRTLGEIWIAIAKRCGAGERVKVLSFCRKVRLFFGLFFKSETGKRGKTSLKQLIGSAEKTVRYQARKSSCVNGFS